MACRDCIHYEKSGDERRRGLDGYGYCKASPSLEGRARFFSDDGPCWLVPNRYEEKHLGA
jgi:hypothetical protein